MYKITCYSTHIYIAVKQTVRFYTGHVTNNITSITKQKWRGFKTTLHSNF